MYLMTSVQKSKTMFQERQGASGESKGNLKDTSHTISHRTSVWPALDSSGVTNQFRDSIQISPETLAVHPPYSMSSHTV